MTLLALGMFSYYIRELLASFAILSVVFIFLAVVTLGGLLAWWVSRQVAALARPSSGITAFPPLPNTTFATIEQEEILEPQTGPSAQSAAVHS